MPMRLDRNKVRTYLEETIDMKCSIDGCPGEYEAKNIMHTVRRHGQVIVIDHVPADVCSLNRTKWRA